MLHHLYIRNFALIEELDIDFHSGFSVITGETGAGKSIILGALGLLLGNRADPKQIKTGKDKCIVEANFSISDDNTKQLFDQYDVDFDDQQNIFRREINTNGKSRAFINDTPVTLAALKDIGTRLIDIHSQHQNLLLGKEDFQLNVVDIIAHDQKELAQYQVVFHQLQSALQQLQQLKETLAKNKENEDFLRFQFNELDDAHLQASEQAELEHQQAILQHAEEIKNSLYEASNLLENDENGAIEQVRTAAHALESIEQVFADSAELAERLRSCHIELKDIQEELNHKLSTVEFDPRRRDEIEQRLDLIYSLEHKHHTDNVEALLQLHDDLQQQLLQLDNSDLQLEELQALADAKRAECQRAADALTAKRAKAAKTIEKEMHSRLIPLGIPNVNFSIDLAQKELSESGQDKTTFLFSANKNTPPQPVSLVASGGEIARVMLSIKALLSGETKQPTIIFDEIDTGVSGRVAEQMAQMMSQMAGGGNQVISITHLPQIAAMGTTHYKVEKTDTKEETITHLFQLDNDQRVNEIAQMLSGSSITDAAIQNAKELLKNIAQQKENIKK